MHKKSRSKKGPRHPPQDNTPKAAQVEKEPDPPTAPIADTAEKKDEQRVPDPNPQEPQPGSFKPETVTHVSNVSEVPSKPRRHRGGRKKKQTGDNRNQPTEIEDVESSSDKIVQVESHPIEPQVSISDSHNCSTIESLQKIDTVICLTTSTTTEQNNDALPVKTQKDKKKKQTVDNKKQPSTINDQPADCSLSVSTSEGVVQEKGITVETQDPIALAHHSSSSVDIFSENLKACQINKYSQRETSEKNEQIQPADLHGILADKKKRTFDNKKQPSVIEGNITGCSSDQVVQIQSISIEPLVPNPTSNTCSTVASNKIIDTISGENLESNQIDKKIETESTVQNKETQLEIIQNLNEKKKKQPGVNKKQSCALDQNTGNTPNKVIQIESTVAPKVSIPIDDNSSTTATIQKVDSVICEKLKSGQITADSQIEATMQITTVQKENLPLKKKKQREGNKKQTSSLDDDVTESTSDKVVQKESLPVKTHVLNPSADSSTVIMALEKIETVISDRLKPFQLDKEVQDESHNIKNIPDNKKQTRGKINQPLIKTEEQVTISVADNVILEEILPIKPFVLISDAGKPSSQKLGTDESKNLKLSQINKDVQCPKDAKFGNVSKLTPSGSSVSECKLEQLKKVNILQETLSTSLESSETTIQVKNINEDDKLSQNVPQIKSEINFTEISNPSSLYDVKNEGKAKGKGKHTKRKHTESDEHKSTPLNKGSFYIDNMIMSDEPENLANVTKKQPATDIINQLFNPNENPTTFKKSDVAQTKLLGDNVESFENMPITDKNDQNLKISMQACCNRPVNLSEDVITSENITATLPNLVTPTNILNTSVEVDKIKDSIEQYKTIEDKQLMLNDTKAEVSGVKPIETGSEKNNQESHKKKGKSKKHPSQKEGIEHLTSNEGPSCIKNQDVSSSESFKSIHMQDDSKQFVTITLPQIQQKTVIDSNLISNCIIGSSEVLVTPTNLEKQSLSTNITDTKENVLNLKEIVTDTDYLIPLPASNFTEKNSSIVFKDSSSDSTQEIPPLVSNELLKICSSENSNKSIQLQELVNLKSDHSTQVSSSSLTIAEEIAESIKEELKCQLALISGSKNKLYEKRIDDIGVETEKNVVKNIESIMKTVENLAPSEININSSEIQQCLPTSSQLPEKSDVTHISGADHQNNKQQKGKGKSKKCNDSNKVSQPTSISPQVNVQAAANSSSQTTSQATTGQETCSKTKPEKQNTKTESDQQKQPDSEKSKTNTETKDSTDTQLSYDSNESSKDIGFVCIRDNKQDSEPVITVAKTDDFEYIRSSSFKDSEKQYDENKKTPDSKKDEEKKSTLTRPKNLIGHPNIPVSSHKVDYKKEKNKSDASPSAFNANPANLLRECNENSPKEYPKDRNKEITINSKTSDFENPTKHLFLTNNAKEKQSRKPIDLDSDDEEEFVYKYNFRNVFLPNACHFCKILLVKFRAVCENCGLIAYCNQNHRDLDWPQHQSLCYAVTTIMQINGLKHLYCKAGSLNGHEYRILRMQMIVLCEKILKRKLLPSEQETLLYPRLCHDQKCREWQNIKLTDCDNCGQVSYCREHPKHLSEDHAGWCTSYKIYHKLVVHQLNKGKIEPVLPNRILPLGYMVPEKSSILMEELYNSNIDMDECHVSTLTQLSTAPLTALYSYQLWKQGSNGDQATLIPSKFTIHIVGAEMQFEVDTLNKWEVFFMHLCPKLENLNLVFIGPELNNSKLPLDLLKRLRLCKFCRQTSKNIDIQFYDGVLYHEYVNGADFSKPDLVCAFNPGLNRTTGYAGQDTWPETIRSIFARGAPFCVTSYTKQELPRDLERISSCTVGHVQSHVLPRLNPYASLRPDRNFLSDDEMPLIFKNYYFMVLSGQTP